MNASYGTSSQRSGQHLPNNSSTRKRNKNNNHNHNNSNLGFAHPLFTTKLKETQYVNRRVEHYLEPLCRKEEGVSVSVASLVDDYVERLAQGGRTQIIDEDVDWVVTLLMGEEGEEEERRVSSAEPNEELYSYGDRKDTREEHNAAAAVKEKEIEAYHFSDQSRTFLPSHTFPLPRTTHPIKRHLSPPPRLDPLDTDLHNHNDNNSTIPVKHSKLMESLEPQTVSEELFLNEDDDDDDNNKEQKRVKLAGHNPLEELYSSTNPNLARMDFESFQQRRRLLEQQQQQQQQQQGSTVTPTTIEEARQHQRAVDTAQLLSASTADPRTYGQLDILLDGNSRVLSKRSAPSSHTQTPLEKSKRLLAQKEEERQRQFGTTAPVSYRPPPPPPTEPKQESNTKGHPAEVSADGVTRSLPRDVGWQKAFRSVQTTEQNNHEEERQ